MQRPYSSVKELAALLQDALQIDAKLVTIHGFVVIISLRYCVLISVGFETICECRDVFNMVNSVRLIYVS